MRTSIRLAVFPFLFVLAGCSKDKPKVVPVSGTVYMDGQPLANVDVAFQPIGSKENPNPGRGSTGRTDEHGHFTLMIDGEIDGAVVARHRVCISSVQKTEFNPETGSPDGERVEREIIPPEYNFQSTLEFEVTKDGTDKADFHLESFKSKKKTNN